MRIRINGQERELPGDTTLAGLLASLDLPGRRVAVERNGKIVTRADYEATVLAEDDRLEIVQFVGGG